ncbi:lytic transglycosylase F [Hahella sp. CCB-MM4]|nr:lytic transglycosylase F [Hahella sp. CCB-MM4]
MMLVDWSNPKRILVLLAAVLIVALTGCSRPTVLERIEQEGVLHVITRNAPTTYYEDRDGAAGFEYELSRLFAEQIGVELRLRVATDLDEAYSVLEQNYTHFAALGLSQQAAHDRASNLNFSSDYLTFQPVVLFANGKPKPKTVDDLIGRSIVVPASTAQAAFLDQLKDARLPNLVWEEADGIETPDMMRMVDEGQVDIAIVNSAEYAIHKAMFPKVRNSFALMEPLKVSWIFPPGKDNSLLEQANLFLEKISQDGTLTYLQEKYFGHVDQLNYVGARTFIKHIRDRLPKFEDTFKAAANDFELDWHLLAAIGYQESHWRPYATSPTGVRGLMMLTRTTAKEMDIRNRLDPEQSILGGAKYFSQIHKRMPERIPEPDRTWMALAAYNVGMGHLEDARIITENQGKDPDKWIDVKDALPLLQQKKWYKKTRFGYARGWEPVHYVQNIRRYYDVLAWMKQPGINDGTVAQSATSTTTSDDFSDTTPDMPQPFRVAPPML